MHAFDGPTLGTGTLTDAERRYAEEFRARFDTDAWLFRKSERNRLTGLLRAGDAIGRRHHKAVGGIIWATLVVWDGAILHVIVDGD